jgi:phage protein U
MFAALGEITFELLHVDGQGTQEAASWAEHALIEGKPRLQWIGEALTEIRLDLSFHIGYCKPDAEIKRLRKAKSDHQAMAYVLGNGVHRGWYVITDLSVTSRNTGPTGTTLAAEVSLTLREYVGDPAKPAAAPAVNPPQLPPSAQLSASTISKAVQAAQASPLASAVSKAVAAAGQARAAMSAVSQGIAIAKGFSANPLAALSRVPGLVSNSSQLVEGLSKIAPALGPVASQLTDAQAVLKPAAQALSAASALKGALGGVTGKNVMGRLADAGVKLDAVSGALDAAAPSLAKLASRVTTRKNA